MSERLHLRLMWPDTPDRYQVLTDSGDVIAQITFESTLPAWRDDRWNWSFNAFRDRHRPSFSGNAPSLEDCKAAVKAIWPDYHAELEYDGILERVRRERLGVLSIMFFYQDEYDTAPGKIEALAGCLEGTVEEAHLS